MNDNPTVSIVIPTYNRCNEVQAAISSALAQTYTNTEIIVVDDGSSDGTSDVLARFGSRIRFVRQENAGASAARNHGVRVSKGQLIAFLDSDDLWLPRKIERQVAVMQLAGHGVPCCLCNIQLAYLNGNLGSSFDLSLLSPALEEGVWQNVLEVLATRFVLFNQAVAVRRDALDAVGGFDETCRFMEDHDLALRLALLGPWGFIRSPLVIWHQGTKDSLTTRAKNDPVALQETVCSIYRKVIGLSESTHQPKRAQHRLILELMKSELRLRAERCIRSKSKARRLFGHAIKQLEHYADKLYTNSPLYPAMETTAAWQHSSSVPSS